jgi:transposase
MIKRREDGGHNVKIIVEVPEEPRPETKRVMALDVNAGHVDFAVAGKERVLPSAASTATRSSTPRRTKPATSCTRL